MKDNPLNRLKVKRGSELTQSKLTENDVMNIRRMVLDREELKQKASMLTNARIAEKFDVHVRTIDRITANESWIHVL